MRLLTLHPKYLDPAGLVALWREGLLAQAVLCGKTRGYRNHPQLERFRRSGDPVAAISAYLRAVLQEAQHRGYAFNGSKIEKSEGSAALVETTGQLLYEWMHLKGKLQGRNRLFYAKTRNIPLPDPHPLFTIADGDVRDWERVNTAVSAKGLTKQKK